MSPAILPLSLRLLSNPSALSRCVCLSLSTISLSLSISHYPTICKHGDSIWVGCMSWSLGGFVKRSIVHQSCSCHSCSCKHDVQVKNYGQCIHMYPVVNTSLNLGIRHTSMKSGLARPIARSRDSAVLLLMTSCREHFPLRGDAEGDTSCCS